MIRFVRPSKMVTDGQKLSRALEAASTELSPDIAQGLVATAFAPWVQDGEPSPDMAYEERRQVWLGRWLVQNRERMVAADEVHQVQVRIERRMRRRRNEAASELEVKIRAVRTTFERVYGTGLTDEVIGVEGDLPDDPVVLLRYAQRITAVMADPELNLPEPRVKGSCMGPAEVIEELTPPLEVLNEVLAGLALQKRQTQRALKEKREAQEASEKASGKVARYFEALCAIAGLDFHAERVRQSSHVRSRGTDEAETDGSTPEGEPGDDGDSLPADDEPNGSGSEEPGEEVPRNSAD